MFGVEVSAQGHLRTRGEAAHPGSENVGQRPQLHNNEGQIQVERSCRYGMLFQGAIPVPYFSP